MEQSKHSFSNASSEEIIRELISRELLDENSHPRARKNLYEKFYLSIERVGASNLRAKIDLIEIYIEGMKKHLQQK